MDEEISLQESYRADASLPREVLIIKYFGDIEERICAARYREQAEQIADQACRGFEQECQSEVIPLFFERCVHKLIEKYWGND